jgi:hypothetical protein
VWCRTVGTMKTLAVLSALGVVVAALPASAQSPITPPVMKPKAATNLYPNGVVHAAAVPRLLWKQGGFFATQQQPPPARHFRVCIYDAAAEETCASTQLEWMYAAGAPQLHQTPVYSPLRGQSVTGTHRYSFDVPAGLLADRSYHWNVGACKSSDEGSCTYAPHAALLRLSTRNLTVTGIEEGTSTTYVTMLTEVANTGTTDAEPFRVASTIIQAVYDEELGRCATIIANSETRYLGVTAAGEFVNVLPSDDIPIVGILLAVNQFELVDTAKGLSAGSSDLRTPLEVPLSAGNPRLPASFLFITSVDPDNSVLEYDESDNRRAECHTVYP